MFMWELLIHVCWEILLPNLENENVHGVLTIFVELRYERERDRERCPGSITTETYSLVREVSTAINLI